MNYWLIWQIYVITQYTMSMFKHNLCLGLWILNCVVYNLSQYFEFYCCKFDYWYIVKMLPGFLSIVSMAVLCEDWLRSVTCSSNSMRAPVIWCYIFTYHIHNRALKLLCHTWHAHIVPSLGIITFVILASKTNTESVWFVIINQ